MGGAGNREGLDLGTTWYDRLGWGMRGAGGVGTGGAR